jgi:hypothetical protein
MVDAAQAQKRALSYLENKLALAEHEGAGRGPWLMMAGRGATRGTLRCFTAPGLDKLVLLTLEDGEQLDASMLMAFGAADSALPHLVIDAARVGRDYAVFVDLLPRLDLAVHHAYTRAVYGPLHDVMDGLAKHPQLRRSPVPHTLRPFVSPWFSGFRLGARMMPQLFELIAPYVSHWLALHGGGLPAVDERGAELRMHDLSHRAGLFSREADPMWEVLGQLLGEPAAGKVLDLLRRHGMPPVPSLRPPGSQGL